MLGFTTQGSHSGHKYKLRRYGNAYSQGSDQGADMIEEEESEEVRSQSGEKQDSEEDLSKSVDHVSENEDGRAINKEISYRKWRSVLLKSG